MHLSFSITYIPNDKETLFLCIKAYERESLEPFFIDEQPMILDKENLWLALLNFKNKKDIRITYHYVVYKEKEIIRSEKSYCRSLYFSSEACDSTIYDYWSDEATGLYAKASQFFNVAYKHFEQKERTFHKLEPKVYFILQEQPLQLHQKLVLVGDTEALGNWQIEKGLNLQYKGSNIWSIAVKKDKLPTNFTYKLVLIDELNETITWEKGENHKGFHNSLNQEATIHNLPIFQGSLPKWKGAGMVLPLFSIRTKNTCGIGDFTALKHCIDWLSNLGMKALQLLPIHDTTYSNTWKDSYPYNPISPFALHPLYIDLEKIGEIKDKKLLEKYKHQKAILNSLPTLDYERVNKLKMEILYYLFQEYGEKTIVSKDYQLFVQENEVWLHNYTLFKVAIEQDLKKVEQIIEQQFIKQTKNKTLLAKLDIQTKEKQLFYSFIQYHLHTQLIEAHQYAKSKGIILKGDIPIGIAKYSDSTLALPTQFHLNGQAGAPPDAFAKDGQNWGFPTYNWEAMKSDNYTWWKQRLKHMSKYFDAFRIDHVLGFFRIWEIPTSAISGLLGQFAPALSFTTDEIKQYGFNIQEQHYIPSFTEEFLTSYLFPRDKELMPLCFKKEKEWWVFNEKFSTQQLIKEHKLLQEEDKQKLIPLFTNVLFVRDKQNKEAFYPRIKGYETVCFEMLNEQEKQGYLALHHHFFYERNETLWKKEAEEKLAIITNCSGMLACAEDLGMLPSSVKNVLENQALLSLEIQHMPKVAFQEFALPETYPYLSVATFSTHDMPPFRNWWKENRDKTQRYYNLILKQKGVAPSEATPEITQTMIQQHLDSPAMLCLLSFQNYIAMSKELQKEHIEDEQINHPDNPNQYWNYRMHLPLETIANNAEFTHLVQTMIKQSGR